MSIYLAVTARQKWNTEYRYACVYNDFAMAHSTLFVYVICIYIYILYTITVSPGVAVAEYYFCQLKKNSCLS